MRQKRVVLGNSISQFVANRLNGRRNRLSFGSGINLFKPDGEFFGFYAKRHCGDAVKDNLKEAKKFENKDAHKMFACRERSCECRAHLHAIERRAETMPIIHEGDSARRKEILAIVKRGVVVGK